MALEQPKLTVRSFKSGDEEDMIHIVRHLTPENPVLR
jgi:hypothetical protein